MATVKLDGGPVKSGKPPPNMFLKKPTVGRRTGIDVLAGKNIRKDEDGNEIFADYFSEADESSFFDKSLAVRPTVPVQSLQAAPIGGVDLAPVQSISQPGSENEPQLSDPVDKEDPAQPARPIVQAVGISDEIHLYDTGGDVEYIEVQDVVIEVESTNVNENELPPVVDSSDSSALHISNESDGAENPKSDAELSEVANQSLLNGNNPAEGEEEEESAARVDGEISAVSVPHVQSVPSGKPYTVPSALSVSKQQSTVQQNHKTIHIETVPASVQPEKVSVPVLSPPAANSRSSADQTACERSSVLVSPAEIAQVKCSVNEQTLSIQNESCRNVPRVPLKSIGDKDPATLSGKEKLDRTNSKTVSSNVDENHLVATGQSSFSNDKGSSASDRTLSSNDLTAEPSSRDTDKTVSSKDLPAEARGHHKVEQISVQNATMPPDNAMNETGSELSSKRPTRNVRKTAGSPKSNTTGKISSRGSRIPKQTNNVSSNAEKHNHRNEDTNVQDQSKDKNEKALGAIVEKAGTHSKQSAAAGAKTISPRRKRYSEEFDSLPVVPSSRKNNNPSQGAKNTHSSDEGSSDEEGIFLMHYSSATQEEDEHVEEALINRDKSPSGTAGSAFSETEFLNLVTKKNISENDIENVFNTSGKQSPRKGSRTPRKTVTAKPRLEGKGTKEILKPVGNQLKASPKKSKAQKETLESVHKNNVREGRKSPPKRTIRTPIDDLDNSVVKKRMLTKNEQKHNRNVSSTMAEKTAERNVSKSRKLSQSPVTEPTKSKGNSRVQPKTPSVVKKMKRKSKESSVSKMPVQTDSSVLSKKSKIISDEEFSGDVNQKNKTKSVAKQASAVRGTAKKETETVRLPKSSQKLKNQTELFTKNTKHKQSELAKKPSGNAVIKMKTTSTKAGLKKYIKMHPSHKPKRFPDTAKLKAKKSIPTGNKTVHARTIRKGFHQISSMQTNNNFLKKEKSLLAKKATDARKKVKKLSVLKGKSPATNISKVPGKVKDLPLTEKQHEKTPSPRKEVLPVVKGKSHLSVKHLINKTLKTPAKSLNAKLSPKIKFLQKQVVKGPKSSTGQSVKDASPKIVKMRPYKMASSILPTNKQKKSPSATRRGNKTPSKNPTTVNSSLKEEVAVETVATAQPSPVPVPSEKPRRGRPPLNKSLNNKTSTLNVTKLRAKDSQAKTPVSEKNKSAAQRKKQLASLLNNNVTSESPKLHVTVYSENMLELDHQSLSPSDQTSQHEVSVKGLRKARRELTEPESTDQPIASSPPRNKSLVVRTVVSPKSKTAAARNNQRLEESASLASEEPERMVKRKRGRPPKLHSVSDEASTSKAQGLSDTLPDGISEKLIPIHERTHITPGLRRSRRPRVKALETWRLQRIVYRGSPSGIRHAIGIDPGYKWSKPDVNIEGRTRGRNLDKKEKDVKSSGRRKLMTSSSSSQPEEQIVDTETPLRTSPETATSDLQEEHLLGRTRSQNQDKKEKDVKSSGRRKPMTASSSSQPEEQVVDIETPLRTSPETAGAATPDHQEEHLLEIVRSHRTLQWHGPEGCMAKETDPFIITKSFQQDGFYSGYLKIRKGQAKPLQVLTDETMVFDIKFGKLKVQVHENVWIMETDDTFMVPVGNAYKIDNVGFDEATLSFYSTNLTEF